MQVHFPCMFIYKVGMTVKSSSGTIMRIKCADGGEAFKIVPDIKKNFFALKTSHKR